MGNGVAAAPGPRPTKPRRPKPRNILAAITESGLFKFFILACIIVNALMLGYDAHFGPGNQYAQQIEMWNHTFLLIFTAELVLEFLAQGPRAYIRDGWNWFDVLIVTLSWLGDVPGVTALRAFRVIRVFRLVSNVPQMQRVVEALLRALPGIAATMSILGIVYYISAIMGTTFFRDSFPNYFGDLARAGATLFQLTLFDDWGAIVGEIAATHPWAWGFFLAFTVLSAFAVLNLFIGVIVDAVQEARAAQIKEEVHELAEDVSDIEEGVEEIAEAQEDAAALQRRTLEELRALRAEVAALRGGGVPPASG